MTDLTDRSTPASSTSSELRRAPGRANRLRRWLGRYGALLDIVLLICGAFTLLRVGLLLTAGCIGLVSGGELLHIFWLGARFDLLVGLCWVFPQLLHLAVAGNRGIGSRLSRCVLEAGWLAGFLALPFLLMAEAIFFNEFQSRLNYIAFEYLVYPTEVCCNIWQSYPTGQLLTLVAAIGITLYLALRRRYTRVCLAPMAWRRRWGLFAAATGLMAALWWTIGIDQQVISDNRAANECAGNGLYSFVYHAWTCHVDFEKWYPTIARGDAERRLRARVVSDADVVRRNSVNPLDRIVAGTQPQCDSNVVVILEESFGAEFVGELSNTEGLTPHFDALCRDGLLFDNFYATGNRTARALEAVLTSLPPIPTESILKRDHSGHVFTLADVLAERGYERLFMTGGRGMFDGVRSFMTANGFNRFIEQSDYERPVFANAWGVSDEDLFHRSLTEMDQLHASGSPFLAVLLTVSNHRPYTFPPGRIADGKQSRESAVRYADWALGDFFAQVREHAFYKNTVFVVMGDHGARVYGSQLFPMSSYQVPVLVIDPRSDRQGTRCHTLGCSIDIAPTIMGRLGGEYRSVFFGRDLLSLRPDEGYALMQHNHDVALLGADGEMTVLGSNKQVSRFHYDAATSALTRETRLDQDDADDATAFYQLANRLYYDEQYYPAPTGRPVAALHGPLPR